MKNRKEILNEIVSESVDDVSSYIDDVESEVNEALGLLEKIDSIEDLSQIEECRDILKELSTRLY